MVNKIFIEEANPIEPKVKVLIPMYEPLEVTECEKCGRIIAEPKESIRIHAYMHKQSFTLSQP